jgi:serine/threonine protein kinase/formylglycine-generating enzyme required for sulfatase activity
MKECPACNLCFDDAHNHCPNDGSSLFTSHNCGTNLSDRYVLERRLGKGGMGAVYKAKHKFLKSLHAIKIISPEVVREDETLLIRFRQEAILAASIHHPNVVTVTDFGVENEHTPFLVMEYIEGISLDDFLRREKWLTPDRALEILEPIVLGVGEAHSKGITHRDLKPLNVMIRNDRPLVQAVKVLDFGLAKIKSTESFASLVQAKTTSLLGSPQYMSPEQWANEDIDNRTDIYSLGILLFQMLTGEVPFNGNSIPNIMYQHLQVSPPTFSSLGFSVAPEIESVLQKALAKKQEERYSTVEEFLSEYKAAVQKTKEYITLNPNEKDDYSSDSSLPRPKIPLTTYISKDADKNYNLPYLTLTQNESLSIYLNQPKSSEANENEGLAREFIHAQNRVEEARNKINEAEYLAQEFNKAQKAAEDARNNVLQAQRKLEEDVRRRLQEEMERKLADEKEAREKAESEARQLMEEVKARKISEERANALAKNALEAQKSAEKERELAEREINQRQLEADARRKAEEIVSKLSQEVIDAKQRYEEAKREAAYEAHYRYEAELKQRKIEEEIKLIKEHESNKRKIAEEQAAQLIKEQVSRLEKQAQEALQKTNEARHMAENEIQKREQAEAARIKAEQEARRLAEEIIEAQTRLEEAQQLAKSESEKRVLEEAARKKAEESARLSSLQNQQNIESFNNSRKTQSYRADSDKTSSPNLNGETLPELQERPSGQLRVNTISNLLHTKSDVADSKQSSFGNSFKLIILTLGLFIFLIVGASGSYLIYKFTSRSSNDGNVSGSSKGENVKSPTASEASDRLNKKMVRISGGTFLMGRNDVSSLVKEFGVQFPANTVSVDNFFIDRTEVSNKEYAEFTQATGHKVPDNWKGGAPLPGEEEFPVTYVSNFDARDFAEWISKRDNIRCQLPTEEEWEYAARSGNQQNIYPWGNEWIPNRVNIDSGAPQKVGTSNDETSIGGIKDMMGNVTEWTFTTFKYYPNFPKEDEDPNIKANIFITVRGSSFAATKDQIKNKHFLLTSRRAVPGDTKASYLGFRLVCRP